MKILLATGIFPPDIGGPATYSENLAFELRKLNFNVSVISYGEENKNLKSKYNFPIIRVSRRYPKPLRYFLYFWHLLKLARKSDLIYAQDLLSAGLPSLLASKFLRKKFLIRVGGDRLWEEAVERGLVFCTLSEYYLQKKSLYEKFRLLLENFILKNADFIIFTTGFQRDIFTKYRKIEKNKIVIIENPFPDPKELKKIRSRENVSGKKILLYAGRLIRWKNLDFMLRSLAKILKERKDLQFKIIGGGPQITNLKKLTQELNIKENVEFLPQKSRQEVLEEIKNSYICLLPTLTDLSPNFALECIALKTPIILAKESGFYNKWKNDLIFIDPKNEEELIRAINYLLVPGNYQEYQEKIRNIKIDRTWKDCISDYLILFQRLQPTHHP